MRYYISDLHFHHKGVNYRMDKRGFPTVEDMNEYMIKAWNDRVRKNDEVVILGDLSLGTATPTTEIVKRLQGKKYLIIGNHDKFLQDRDFDRTLFQDVCYYREMNDDGRKVILSHYPIFCYNGQFRKDSEGNAKVYMLHGHVHNTLDMQLLDQFVNITRTSERQSRGVDTPQPIPCNLINCFCMYSNYVPWTLDEWIAYDEQRRRNPLYAEDWKYDG